MACAKRSYAGVASAKQRTKHAGWRFRVYWCLECRAYHTSNSDKDGDRNTVNPYGKSHHFFTTRARRAKHSRLPGER